jgi:hypothetical protein
MSLKGGGKFEGHSVDVLVVGSKSKEDEGRVFVIDEGDRVGERGRFRECLERDILTGRHTLFSGGKQGWQTTW